MHCLNRGSCYLVNSHSDVSESNERQRESYEASWLDLVLETRPWQESTVSEKDTSRRESYEQKQVAHLLLRRSPDQSLWLGRQGGTITKHQLPHRSTIPDPPLTPSQTALPKASRRSPSPTNLRQQLKSIMDLESNGVCLDKQEVSLITKDLPRVSPPIRVNFRASCLISPPRESSLSFQR
ncbi:telethonin [Osmerus mordax]|uniref:telethonin n=1 Tax=Osmerus mordax TaxID=8014 RepID=UPI003510A754